MFKKLVLTVLGLALVAGPLLADVATDNPQGYFETHVLVYPNPVRGSGTFQAKPVRDNATLTLKIYTLNGTLILNQTFPFAAAGAATTLPWNAVNINGEKVGRGLYYYVVREESPGGALSVTKKMAVLP